MEDFFRYIRSVWALVALISVGFPLANSLFLVLPGFPNTGAAAKYSAAAPVIGCVANAFALIFGFAVAVDEKITKRTLEYSGGSFFIGVVLLFLYIGEATKTSAINISIPILVYYWGGFFAITFSFSLVTAFLYRNK